MRSTILSIALLLTAVSAVPSRRDGGKVHCGTTSDATLSDCQALVTPDIWNAVFNTANTCHFTNPSDNLWDYPAWNLACHGNCCAYFTQNEGSQNPNGVELLASQETLRQKAAGLMGCGDVAKNKINGMEEFSDHSAICLSNGKGCGDCFDDSDFSRRRRRANPLIARS